MLSKVATINLIVVVVLGSMAKAQPPNFGRDNSGVLRGNGNGNGRNGVGGNGNRRNGNGNRGNGNGNRGNFNGGNNGIGGGVGGGRFFGQDERIFDPNKCSVETHGCNLPGINNATSVFVCRQPIGSICIPKDRVLQNDTCGCCEQLLVPPQPCPSPCGCKCNITDRSGFIISENGGVLVDFSPASINANPNATRQVCVSPGASINLVSRRARANCSQCSP